jgi:adenylate cyclase
MEEMVFPKNPDSAADPGEEYSGSPKIVRDHVTVLFAGIKGFRRYAERKELKEVLRDLNGYLAVVTETIVDHGGYIDKFVGDAVIGVFGHNPLQPDHTLRATRSAVAIQRALKNASTDGNQLLSKVGIGISSGVVLSGHIGSDEKKELSYIGESFKAAYTLNVMAGPGEIVISKEVYQSLAGLVSAEPLPPREMIQRTGPWESFRLHGIGEGKGGC